MSIEKFIEENERKELLRFSTAGSIDDGKSTLIGRLLHDSKNVYEDQLLAVKKVSKEKTSVEKIDFALLTDGLKAEREQGITIDVAYRYFSTPRRKFIIADTPGHEQYTRNMATGASTANLSIVLIDARNGILKQTRRHAFITSLLGVPHLVVAVNKMDVMGYSEEVFNRIKQDFTGFAGKLRIPDIRFIPMSALVGDNVVERSERMPWYKGESLLEILENVYIASDHNFIDMRFPVQYVLRPDMSFRGYCGQVASGMIRKGDEIMVLPSRKVSRVKSIVTFDGEVDCAFPPMSVTITLENEIDISRGDMLVHLHNVPIVDRHFEAMVVWMNEAGLDLNKSYFIKHTTKLTRLRIDELRYKVDVDSLKRMESGLLGLNEIGRIVFTATTPLFYDSYDKNRATGGFILIDPISNNTVAAGMIIDREPVDKLPSRITGNEPADAPMTRRDSRVLPDERLKRWNQRPATVWLTGLVGAGKTDIAYALEKRLFDLGAVCVVLDGENIRLGVNKGLDFSSAGMAEHLRRVAEIARLTNGAGLIVVCAFVSPEASLRKQVAEIIGKDRFVEVYVEASAEWCEKRDKSGLYAKAKSGDLKNLAGVNASYDAPKNPDIVLPIEKISCDEAVTVILNMLRDKGVFPCRSY
ncbi:MAG: sulfate adenylyltransferase subunit CysN [Kiritimatiellae bacterium]|nr:sulfate adenylyltransferase subunit CysN [Kiritimatiellia bacterium]MDD5522703.1 sulfate adenylyltransferase subunit CysN [Kiritimatiellia bacterium]